MVQPFSSVYTKDYRSFEWEPRIKPENPCPDSQLKENFLPAEDAQAIYNAERDEVVLQELYLKRLITTYQISYCSPVTESASLDMDADLDADQLMVHFSRYYSKRTEPINRPLKTFKRVFNYTRFDNYYTGRTTYEEEIGKEAYEFFKKDYDEGKSRLFRKRQKALLQKSKQNQVEQGNQQAQDKPSKQNEAEKDKICALCCKKFGNFCSEDVNGKSESEGNKTHHSELSDQCVLLKVEENC